MRQILAVCCCCLALHGSRLQAEEEIVVGEDAGVVSDETSPLRGWCLLECSPRVVDGRSVFVRQSAEAFADPDARGGLDLKYFFKLPEELCPAKENLSRGNESERISTLNLPNGEQLDFSTPS